MFDLATIIERNRRPGVTIAEDVQRRVGEVIRARPLPDADKVAVLCWTLAELGRVQGCDKRAFVGHVIAALDSAWKTQTQA